MDIILDNIGRSQQLFDADLKAYAKELESAVNNASFLIIGGAGSIGQAVTLEVFKRKPKKLHVVDISENNLVELVRDIRSSMGYIDGDFRTFAIDAGSSEFDALLTHEGPYDYILNLSALKHVRSEKDAYTLMRMIKVNIQNVDECAAKAASMGAKKYFCVSTDKAANPVNMMGASKRIMELFLLRRSLESPISTARFANVAFSDGSLLHGFRLRMQKGQPLSAPNDVQRYFMTPQESGQMCLMSCILGDNRDIFFPKLNEELHLITFDKIARRFLEVNGYEAYECGSEEEARRSVSTLSKQGKWPCYFFKSSTTGEKDYEEFYMNSEKTDLTKFEDVGIVKSVPNFQHDLLDQFKEEVEGMKNDANWSTNRLIDLFNRTLPEFKHKNMGEHLDNKM